LRSVYGSETTKLTTEDDVAEAASGCRDTRKVLGMRSMAISPNQDKLLKHEERSERSTTTFPENYNSMEAESMGSAAPPAGLPPPRRNRQMSSRALSPGKNTDSSAAPNFLSWSSNPYINPAPTAEELFMSSSHDSAHPTPGPLQQSNAQKPPSSCLQDSARYSSKSQTSGKGGNFLGISWSIIYSCLSYPCSAAELRLFANSLNHGRGRTLSRTPKDSGFAARSTSTLSDNSLDPTTHCLSVIEI
jgi:hypothetical protein